MGARRLWFAPVLFAVAKRLRRFGLRDRHLDWRVPRRDVLRFAVRELALAVGLMPAAALGFALFFVPYQLTAFAARRLTRERDVLATAQVLSGALIYGGWFGLTGWLLWRLWGPTPALATALILPVLALLCLRAIEREAAVLDTVRAWFLLRRARDDTRERLRRSRSDLADVLDEVRTMLNGES